jgi:probable phosphoglycerate mutase
MAQFYIARHGETENNRAGRLSGWVDTPLTAEGLLPTGRVVAKLHGQKIDMLCASDLGRAFITAYVISRKLGFTHEIQRLPGLREVNYGQAGNMLKAEAYACWPQLDRDTLFVPPGGESLENMQKRVLATLDELNTAGHTIVIVAHSGVMAALHASLTGGDFGKHNITDDYPHDALYKFTLENGRVTSFSAM